MKRVKVGLNGFGRIGRAFARVALLKDSFDIVLIKFGKDITISGSDLSVAGKTIKTSRNSEIQQIPWDSHQVDVVVDATGAFEKEEELKKHLKGSVKKVILTAPSKDETMPHVVFGVNDEGFDF